MRQQIVRPLVSLVLSSTLPINLTASSFHLRSLSSTTFTNPNTIARGFGVGPNSNRKMSNSNMNEQQQEETILKKNNMSLPSMSSRIEQTFDPCVVLMKEMIGQYSNAWEDKGGIYSLAQGVVYWSPPPLAKKALRDALDDETTTHTYGPDEGLPLLRETIQEKIQMENGLKDHEVMVTVGANQAYTNCVLTLMNQHQKCVVFAPYYFNHVMAIQLSLPSESLVVGPSSPQGIPDLDWLEQSLQQDPSIHTVTIVNPGNPTGVVLSRDLLQRAVDLCKQYHCWLILDCTYEYFVAQPNVDEFCCFPDPHVLHIFSFSKSYALAGYRCGYVVMSKQSNIFPQMLKVQDTIPITPSRIAQMGAVGAMKQGKQWVQEQYETLQNGRLAILKALQPLQPNIMGGTGAMYVMAKLTTKNDKNATTADNHSIIDDQEICRQLVKDYGVAVIPGSFCGFPGWIRVCYSNLSPTVCIEAAKRLEKGILELCSS